MRNLSKLLSVVQEILLPQQKDKVPYQREHRRNSDSRSTGSRRGSSNSNCSNNSGSKNSSLSYCNGSRGHISLEICAYGFPTYQSRNHWAKQPQLQKQHSEKARREAASAAAAAASVTVGGGRFNGCSSRTFPWVCSSSSISAASRRPSFFR